MKRVVRRPVAGLAVVGAIALIAGCGGGDDSEALSTDESRPQTSGTSTALDPADGASTTLDPVEGDEGDSGDAGEPAGAAVGVSEYVADAQETAGSLQSFGELLQTVTSADDLETVAPQAQDLLDDFDAGIATMEGYTVDEPQAERQRAVLVSEGPAVSDVLRRFVDAAASGDAAAVQNLLPQVLDALQSFSSAIGATTQP